MSRRGLISDQIPQVDNCRSVWSLIGHEESFIQREARSVRRPFRHQTASIIERKQFCGPLLNLRPNEKTVDESGSGLTLFQRIVNNP